MEHPLLILYGETAVDYFSEGMLHFSAPREILREVVTELGHCEHPPADTPAPDGGELSGIPHLVIELRFGRKQGLVVTEHLVNAFLNEIVPSGRFADPDQKGADREHCVDPEKFSRAVRVAEESVGITREFAAEPFRGSGQWLFRFREIAARQQPGGGIAPELIDPGVVGAGNRWNPPGEIFPRQLFRLFKNRFIPGEFADSLLGAQRQD